MTQVDLMPLLEPTSVAVIGASQKPKKAGHILLKGIQEGGFPGALYPVNPKADVIAGLKCYPSVLEIPNEVDLAFIVLPRHLVFPTVKQCVDAGVKALCIITAGFAEGDDWGKEEQEKIRNLVTRHGITAIGPNTIGTVSMGGLLRGSFVPFARWDDGPVAIVAQTGIFSGAVLQQLMLQENQRIGLNASVDIGNRVGIDEIDMLDALSQHDKVDVIGFYIEEFLDAPRFLARAGQVNEHKPVIILKSGRTPEGARAALAHTGSEAADDTVIAELLQQHGIVRAENIEDFLALLKGFSFTAIPSGRRIGVLTYSGGMGVVACDLLIQEGLELASLSPQTVEEVSELAPAWQELGNPMDLWSAAEIDPKRTVEFGFSALLEDPGVDQVLGLLLTVPPADFEGIRDAFANLREAYPDKPIHLVMAGGLRKRWLDEVEGLGIPVYDTTLTSIRVMKGMAKYNEYQQRLSESLSSGIAL